MSGGMGGVYNNNMAALNMGMSNMTMNSTPMKSNPTPLTVNGVNTVSGASIYFLILKFNKHCFLNLSFSFI